MKRLASLVALSLVIALSVPALAFAGAPTKTLNADGSVPVSYDLAKPPSATHPDAQPSTAGGTGDGSNNISFAAFDDGDIIVVLGTALGHAGEWDEGYYAAAPSLYTKCIWSANTTPVNGVQREAPIKYRAYDRAYGLWVPSLSSTKRTAARTYCRGQVGEPYNINSSKSDQSRWYCSKLVWSSYRYTASADLDADSGFWVWPVDLLNDSQTALFTSGN